MLTGYCIYDIIPYRIKWGVKMDYRCIITILSIILILFILNDILDKTSKLALVIFSIFWGTAYYVLYF